MSLRRGATKETRAQGTQNCQTSRLLKEKISLGRDRGEIQIQLLEIIRFESTSNSNELTVKDH